MSSISRIRYYWIIALVALSSVRAQEIRGLPAGMDFVTIPAGTYLMGSPVNEIGRRSGGLVDQEIQHEVSVDSFQLMTTEVTQGMWEEVMETDIYYLRNNTNPDWDLSGVGSSYPVYYVSWENCHEFIERLNLIDPTYNYRLPSEAEWEYACRAGSSSRFFWGNSDAVSDISKYCWYRENSDESAQPVGLLEPNAWGLFDMIGNVCEWCEDVYPPSYDDCPTDGSPYKGSGRSHVVRGGSFGAIATACRSAFRLGSSSGDFITGFRVARSLN